MHKQGIPVCGLVLTLLAALLVDHGLAKEPMAGGWSPETVTNKEVVAAADFVVKAQAKVMQAKIGEVPAKMQLVAIQAAEKQVVAGMNYRLDLKVKLNGKEKTAKAVVWWQAWRQPDPYQLTSWNWR